MKALVLAGKELIEIVDLPVSSPPEHDIAVRVAASGICRTDAKMWHSGHRDLELPRVPGHEFCGYVDDAPGKLYSIWPGSACGTCKACRSGRENLCPAISIIGFHRDGGFAETVHVPKSSLLEVPNGLNASMATLAEPLACAIHGMKQSRSSGSDRVLIFGAGTLGILLGIAAADRGARVAITDPNAEKMEKSSRFRDDTGIETLENSTSASFDVMFNATSSAVALSTGICRLAPGGRFCLFSGLGQTPERTDAIFHELHYRELELVGSYGCTRQDMRDALLLLDRYRNDLGFLIERELRLEDVPTVIGTILDGRAFRQVIVM